MKIQAKNDVSYLFSSLNNSSSSTGVNSLSSILSDYASIKNGSYGKLIKAYYTENASEQVSSIAKDSITSEDDAASKALAKVQTKTDALKASAEALISTEDDSVWASEDMDKIYSAVKSYVSDYNAVLESMEEMADEAILKKGLALINNTSVYEKALDDIGITVNEDDTLTLDEKAFKAAGIDAAQKLFQGKATYGYAQALQTGYLKSAVDYEAVKTSTYNYNGTYNTIGNTGSLFDSLF